MSKQTTNQRLIYKIHSSRFRINDWDLILTSSEAKDNEEIVPLGDSITLRMIRKIKNDDTTEDEIFNIKKQLKKLKKSKKNNNSDKITELYNQLEKKTLIEDYIVVVFDNIADWNRFNSRDNPISFNNNKYVRLVGTNGGVKNNTVIFCKKDIHDGGLDKRLNNGRDTKKKYVPAKFESYKALACSVSTPVTQPKGVLVIKDGETTIYENVIQLSGNKNGGFNLTEVQDYEIKREFTDGCGMISEALSKQWCIDLGCYTKDEKGKKVAEYTPTGFNIRNSWTKGMVFTFPYLDFAEDVAKKYIVKDAWGNDIDIRNVELIITTNMLKLWDAYSSIEDYLSNCKENGFEYCVAKMLPKELETVRDMNYQFLQSYDFTDDDIDKLTQPTVDAILGAISEDYGKMLLFLKGNKITEDDFLHEDYNFVKALMINENMKDDPFVKRKIHRMIKKRINDSMKGVLQVNGNYSIISGDLYALCEYMFGMKVKGLLKKGEYYSRAWLDKDIKKVVAYRAPMTNHNNIKIFNFKDNADTKKWYRFMTTCIILNAFDATVDAINGADFDGDAVITTDNEILLKNTKELLPIICEQKTINKQTITEKQLRNANKNGFGNDVGGVTNKCTGMFDVLASLEKDSKEYHIMIERIICMQGYQQEIIDSVKGCIAKKVPRYWYDYKELKIKTDDSPAIKEWKEEQLKLASYKKPYFFMYNYKYVMNKYNKYISNSNTNSLIRFGLTLDELQNKEDKNTDELDFLKYYKLLTPVFKHKSTMNRICWNLEEKFKDIDTNTQSSEDFDMEVMKSDNVYSKAKYDEIAVIYKEYRNDVRQYMITSKNLKSEEKKEKRIIFINEFKKKVYNICSNEYILCNILIDMCYSNGDSKQFVWDICGKIIIENLLDRSQNKIHYPVIVDKDEDFNWNGNKYKMIEMKITEGDDGFIC
jgi:hypothetical protein